MLASFNRLLLTRGFNDVTVQQLTADANVGRSTFYEHFAGKDDLLKESVSRLLATLAATVAARTPSDALHNVLGHLGDHRELAGSLLSGATRAILIRVLADELELQLAERARYCATPPLAPLALLAKSLAHTQLGILDAWVAQDGRCDLPTTTRLLRGTTRACVAAFFDQ